MGCENEMQFEVRKGRVKGLTIKIWRRESGDP